MAYQRANWHSGLVYSQVCDQCKAEVTYMDDELDFRPWFADGFVYCHTCRKPLRHNEGYAINRPVSPFGNWTAPTPSAEAGEVAMFCSNCGRAFCEGENFCPNCGKKR